MKITKRFLIDAIVGGCGIPMGGINEHLTPFTGNQWNEDWSWNRKALEEMDMENLEELYLKYSGPQEV